MSTPCIIPKQQAATATTAMSSAVHSTATAMSSAPSLRDASPVKIHPRSPLPESSRLSTASMWSAVPIQVYGSRMWRRSSFSPVPDAEDAGVCSLRTNGVLREPHLLLKTPACCWLAWAASTEEDSFIAWEIGRLQALNFHCSCLLYLVHAKCNSVSCCEWKFEKEQAIQFFKYVNKTKWFIQGKSVTQGWEHMEVQSAETTTYMKCSEATTEDHNPR
jgi:hypothetical protein